MISKPTGQGGIATHVSALVDVLASRGLSIEVVEPASGPLTHLLLTLSRGLRRTGLEMAVRFDRRVRRSFLEIALRRRSRRHPPALVYAQDPLAAHAAMRATRPSGAPVVMVVHYNESQAEELVQRGLINRGRTEQLIRRFEASVIRRLSGIVYVSDFMRRRIEQDVPAAAPIPSVVIPNFLPDVDFEPVPTAPQDLISVGSLVPRKNHAYLLRVLSIANRTGHRYHLTLVGDGPDREALRHLAVDLGLVDQVSFMGYRSDVEQLLRRHRVYLHSAEMENAPFALIEALRCGLPVVYAPVGGLPEIVGSTGAGRIWDLADPDRGAAVLTDLLDDEPALIVAGREARARFDQKFRADVVCQRLLDFFATAGGPNPRNDLWSDKP